MKLTCTMKQEFKLEPPYGDKVKSNSYPGPCRGCGLIVKANEGFFERYKGVWWCRHRECTKKSLSKIAKGVKG